VAIVTIRKQHGFGVLEVLITLLVLSFGLLALAYMQIWSMANGKDSEIRSRVSIVASELMDRMRISQIKPSSTKAADYLGQPVANSNCDIKLSSASNDRNCFYANLSKFLPSVAARITRDLDSAPPTYKLSVAWPDQQSELFVTAIDGVINKKNCTDNGRLFSSQLDGLHWYPANSKPSADVCMEYLSWVIVP
jgi:type IV pilus assembly protein PilV